MNFQINNNYTPYNAENMRAYSLNSSEYKKVEDFDIPYLGTGNFYELKNGHKVGIISKKGAFSINTIVKTGDKNPVAAHLVEHLIYNSQNVINGTRLDDKLDTMAVTRNAVTNGGNTVFSLEYSFDNPSEINDLIKTQLNLLTNAKENIKLNLDREKAILKSEYTLLNEKIKGLSDSKKTELKILDKTINAMFNAPPDVLNLENHLVPLNNKDIDKINADDLLEFHNKHYTPNNMLTVIIADEKPDNLIKLVGKEFNKLEIPVERNTDIIASKKLTPKIDKPVRFDMSSDIKVENNINVNFIGSEPTKAKENMILSLLKYFINSNNQDYKMNTFDMSEYNSDTNLLTFSVSSKNGDEEKVLQELYSKIQDLKNNPINNDRIALWKADIKNNRSFLSEYPRFFIEKLQNNNFERNPGLFKEEMDELEKITPDDVQNYLKKYINFEKACVSVLHNPASIKNRLSFGASQQKIEAKDIVEYKYPNNLKLIVDTSANVKRTAYRVSISSDEINQINPAASEILGLLIQENIEKFSKNKSFSDYNISLNNNGIDVYSSCLPENTIPLINIINSSIQNFALNPQILEKSKEKLKLHKEIENLNGYEQFSTSLFYKDYPLESTTKKISDYSEKIKLIENVKKEEVFELHKKLMNNGHAKVVLVMPKNSFERNKNNIFSEIQNGYKNFQPNVNKLNIISRLKKSYVYLDRINSDSAQITQTYKIIGCNNLKQDITISIINNILGNMLTSKLEQKLRQEKGLYNTRSKYKTDGQIGSLTLGCDIKLDKNNFGEVKNVITIFDKEIKSLKTEPTDKNTLEKAKKKLKADVNNLLESSLGRTEVLNAFDIKDVQGYFSLIDSITIEDVKNVSNKIFTDKKLTHIKTNQDVLDLNHDFLSQLGEVKLGQ